MSGSVLAAFLRRDWRIDLSYRAAFALQFAGIFLELALFFYLSEFVDISEVSGAGDLEGGYFGFVAVGLALLAIVQVGLGAFSRRLREEQTTGTLEALLTTPTSASTIVLSSAAYDLLRATAGSIVLIAVAVVFFGLSLETDPASLAATFGAVIGCLGLFAALGVLVAAVTIVIKRATGLLGLIATVLGLLGGVYFPIEVLPPVIEAVAKVLPFTWGLDVARSGLLGGGVDGVKLAALLGSAAVLLPLTLVVFRRSVQRARADGSLAEY